MIRLIFGPGRPRPQSLTLKDILAWIPTPSRHQEGYFETWLSLLEFKPEDHAGNVSARGQLNTVVSLMEALEASVQPTPLRIVSYTCIINKNQVNTY